MQGSSSGIFPPFSDDRMSAKQSAETWGSKTRMSSRICTAFYDRRFPIKEELRNIKFEKKTRILLLDPIRPRRQCWLRQKVINMRRRVTCK